MLAPVTFADFIDLSAEELKLCAVREGDVVGVLAQGDELKVARRRFAAREPAAA